MPNWCDNSVTLTHEDKSKVDALEAVLQSEDKQVFQHLRPMPESEKDNWYDWNINHWGTKWEMSIIDWERRDDNSIWISFETAWAPPIAIYEYLDDQEWQVEGLYHESGMTFCGIWSDGDDDYYEYDFTDLDSLESLPMDLQDFTGLIDYYHDQEAEREREEEDAKKTEWFDKKVKPVRIGIYEVKDVSENWPFYKMALWDGSKWSHGAEKIKIGGWRGLKENPNEAEVD